MTRHLLATLIALCACAAHAEGSLLSVPTRDGVTTAVFWETAPNARATVLLFPGGGGGFGRVEDGKPTGQNFLVRSEGDFIAQGFNVAIFGRPSDSQDLDYADRIAEPHLADIAKVMAVVREKADVPIWLVGTSRGTVSATAAAIRMPDQIAGLVLSSSVVSAKKPGAVPTQDLAAITVPTLVLHHSKDACPVCDPQGVPAILRGLKNAPVKKLQMVSGGDNPSGNVCEALHWHGYIGMEREAVGVIAAWIRTPAD
ncbi:alpha/beta hydrolase [Niveibacterium sp. COAC-50]|uniref:alpha/beta hydrolase n=1 Tax=Niveibacterium sp. COAC-50 TaxID=2729384 RepID=UPI0015577542|nr:alpha/beta hydrolase [Niveibacterium sp. COAC-50]